MSSVDIIRAWKDTEYRQSLSEAEREQLPEHPVGLTLSDAELAQIGGAGTTTITYTVTTTTSLVPTTETYTGTVTTVTTTPL